MLGVDGDTIQIGIYSIRLFGIDAPELDHPLDHPYGRKAKSAMNAPSKGHVIRAEFCQDQSHNREVARCYLPDVRDLSEELARLGLAIDWRKYSNGCYAKFETTDARKSFAAPRLDSAVCCHPEVSR
jgi:micrococcal nuclease